jgi:hypothetical protein
MPCRGLQLSPRPGTHRALKQLDASSSWVGDLLPVVEIDNWGKFRFVLVRVKDDSGRNKLILRGRNYAQEDALTSQLRQQVGPSAAHALACMCACVCLLIKRGQAECADCPSATAGRLLVHAVFFVLVEFVAM